MKTIFLTVCAVILFFGSCTKSPQILTTSPTRDSAADITSFVQYTIEEGQHFCDSNVLTKVDYEILKFAVRFDSSAIYRTLDETNQDDINKLFGFSDNAEHHHRYSARFGWRWSDNQLRLFGYVYNDGKRSSVEIMSIIPGLEYLCSIRVFKTDYKFSVNNKSVTMPRKSSTLRAVGYKLYPYFGGNETAPHTIHIWIDEITDLP